MSRVTEIIKSMAQSMSSSVGLVCMVVYPLVRVRVWLTPKNPRMGLLRALLGVYCSVNLITS